MLFWKILDKTIIKDDKVKNGYDYDMHNSGDLRNLKH